MLPKILMAAWKAKDMAAKYGPIIPHINNGRATTVFLGNSLKDLKNCWEDEDSGTFFTIYESVEKVVEIKVFTFITARNLEMDTKGKTQFEVLQSIVNHFKAKNDLGAIRNIEGTMAWTQEFMQREDVQQIFNETNIDIPAFNLMKPLEWPKVAMKTAERIGQEAGRIHKLMKAAKNKPGNDNKGPGNTPPRP